MKRSADLMTVGCFLSRYGTTDPDGKSAPPEELETSTWAHAYLCFYRSLSGGRSIRQFGHALKNTRDEFDGFFSSGRVGWRSKGAIRDARPLTPDMQLVFNRCSELSRPEHWQLIAGHHSLTWNQIEPSNLDRPIGDGGSHDEVDIVSRTEGGQKVVLSSRLERDPRLRAQAIELHGPICVACSFDFEATYGSWGTGFCEVHHLSPLREAGRTVRLTNPLYDLVVVCANCHRMIHRRRDLTLSIEELRQRLEARHDPSG